MNELRKIVLSELASMIDSGLTQRNSRGLRDDRVSNAIKIIKAKDIENGAIAAVDTLDWVEGQYAKNLVSRELDINDVLVATKGTELKAAKVTESHKGFVFADTLTRIRLKDVIIPDYLVLIFSMPQTTKTLMPKKTGINTTFISKKELETFAIPVPDIELQHKFIRIYTLFQKEKELTGRLLEMKERLVIESIMQKLQ